MLHSILDNQALAKTIIKYSNEAIICTTLDGVIAQWNPAAQKLFGYTKKEALDKYINMLISPEKTSEQDFLIKKIKNGEKMLHFGIGGIKKNGKMMNLSLNVAPIKDNKENVMGTSIIVQDLTDQKEIIAKYNQLLEKEVLSHSQTKIARQYLYDLLEQTPILFAALSGPNHTYEFINEATRKVLGYQNIIGKTVKEVFPDNKEEIARFDKVYRTGKPVLLKERAAMHEWAPGKIEERIFNFIVHPTRNIKNKITGIMQLGFEVTEQVKIRRKLEATQNLLQSIMNSSTSLIYVKNLKGEFIIINRQFGKMLGMSPEKIEGKTDYDLFPKEMADHYRKNDRTVLKEKKTLQWEEQAILNNKVHTFLSVKFTLSDKKGKPYAVCGISTDISERKELERKKDEFIGVASHELKTPVTSLKANTQLLQKETEQKGEEEISSRLLDMDQQLDKLTHLISQLLDISKIHAGKLQYKLEIFSIRDLIHEISKRMQYTTENQKIISDTITEAYVSADRDRIGQVLINFISNAIKYSPRESEIIISSEVDKQKVIVSVQDFGIGIEPSQQHKIFERFYQASDPTTKTFAGLGIGLYISSEIIRRHKGSIWVKSEKGKGSTFFFSLPLAKN